MNRALRKRHARIWLILWPVFIIGVILAIKVRPIGPPITSPVEIGDSE